MAENINGSIVIDGEQKKPKEHVIIQQAVASATSTFKDSENYVYENIARLSRVQAVLDATLGSSGQNQAVHAYDCMNFDNDSYLDRIGMGSGGQCQKQLDDYMSKCSFESVSTPQISGYTHNENGISLNSSGFSNEELSKIQSSGKFEYQGISYGATVDANNNVQLTSSFGNMFQQAESSKLTIDLDPTKGINTFHTSISAECLSKEERASIGESGSFSRGGVTYNASPVNSTVVDISASFTEGSQMGRAIYAQNNVPFSQVNYQMNGSALNHAQITKVVQNDGTYDLGGMKFSAVPTPFTTKDASGNTVQSVSQFNSSTAQRLLNNANNEYANNRARIDVHGKEDKASVLYDIQKRGQNYICSQSSYLRDNFNGRNARSCISHIDREISSLKSAKLAGWESKVAALTDQKNLLIEYDKHGGRIQNPTKNKAAMGRDIIMGQMLGSDMMRGVNFYRTGLRTARTAYRAATGLTTNVAYLGSKFSNNILQKSISAVAGKDYVGVEKLKAIQKGTDKLYYSRKDRIRAKKEGRYKEYKRDRKNQRFTEKGNRLENKRAKYDKKLTETISDKNKLVRNGGVDTKDYKKLRAKEDRLKRKIDRNDKKKQIFAKDSAARRKKASPSSLQKLKSKIKNSPLGKLFNKLSSIFSLPGRIMAFLKKIALKAALCLLSAYGHFMIVITMLLLTVFTVVLFVSNLSIPGDLTKRLNNQNYQQMIIDIVEEDIAQDLQIICEVDATNHYLSKQHVKHESYPWYYAAKMGEIDHVWVWEESDNTTRYANEGDNIDYDEHALPTGLTGELVYANESLPYGENGNTYVSQPMRTELSNIEANMIPIVTMGHLRYYDDLDFNRWPTVLGYTYYMFALSHDISRYDTEAQYNHFLYGDTEKDPGYDYRIENFCDKPDGPLYAGEEIQWDPETHTLSRDEEICQNIYIHDFPAEGYKCGVTSVQLDHYSKVSDNPVTKTIRNISSYAQKYIGKITGNKDEKADIFDKGYTDSNDILTLNLRKASLKGIKNREITDMSISMTIEQIAQKHPFAIDIDKNASGIFMYDGNPESLPHAQSHEGVGGRDLNGLGAACDKVLYFPYGVTEDSGAEEGDSDEARLIPGEDVGAIDDCHDHSWTKGCFTLICGEEESEGKWVDGDGNETIPEAYGAKYEAGHTHSIGCYDLTSFECAHGKAYSGTGGHEPWEDETNHGCWKTVSICGGHCGGHITPLINIVQKMTYEGLAQDDNFKTTYWLQAEEVTNSAGYTCSGMFGLLDKLVEDNIVTVGQFRSYWMVKCNTWFSPLPRSPYSFYKTIGKSMIRSFCEAWDAVAGLFNKFLGNITGGLAGGSTEEPADEPLESNNWLEKESENGDKWQWDGWWSDPYTIDISLISEMESYTGTYKDNEFESGKKNWADFDVQFGSMGLSNPIYTPEEIESIINMIAASYDFSGMELTAKQRAILEAALSRCGTFGYSLSGSAHNNAINSDSGRGDCSGWVTGTLLKALGVNYNTNAAGYANKGVYNGVKKPGSVIAHKNGGAGYSGHVMIYAGYLNDGPDGPGHYVMDCSSSKGGSSFRKVSQTTLDRYKYVWNP